MKCFKFSLLLIMCFTLIVPTGCSVFKDMNKTGKSSLIGGAGGGAVGAGVGALVGGGKGAWIGALVGTAVGAGTGAAIGHKMDKQQRELEQQLEELRTEAGTRDTVIQIERVKDSNNLDAIKIVVTGGILFPTGSSTLSPEAHAVLSQIAFNLKQNKDTNLTIVGYTDNTGSYEVNMRISKQRAESVMNYLSQQGVPMSRMKTIGEGWNNPVASNYTAEGRKQNRRVELFITADEKMIESAQ